MENPIKIDDLGVSLFLETPIIFSLKIISLGILAHRTSEDEIGVYNHFRNARYLGSMKPFSEGEPGSLGFLLRGEKTHRYLHRVKVDGDRHSQEVAICKGAW